jgi:hypothetical protein
MVWHPRIEFRTNAWHIREDQSEGYCYWQYVPHYDEIGVETGQAHLTVWKKWPSFGEGNPTQTMTVEAALETLARIEAENDVSLPRVNFRKYEHYRDIGYEYHSLKHFSEHPRLTAPETDVSKPPGICSALNAAARATPIDREFDPRTWRTAAFYVTGEGSTKYNAFWEIRACPEKEKADAHQCLLYTWRIGPNSVFCHGYETSVQSAIGHLQYQEKENSKYGPAVQKLSLPPEFFAAEDYRKHPSLNPEDVTVGKPILKLKPVRLKP